MTNNIIYIGLDVDDANFHDCALEPSCGETLTFKCRPTVKGLIRQVNKVQKAFPGHQVTICYEATYIGNTLKRDLHAHNIACDVVAPSSIPQVRGKKIKTDRIDPAQLAQFYANGLLTAVTIPDEEQEMDRDLLRSRNKLQDIQSDLRRHIHGLLRRNNRHFKVETDHKAHWTGPHYRWLDKVVKESTGSFKSNLILLLKQLKDIDLTVKEYQKEIDTLAQSVTYQSKVEALTCYKGIRNLFAMTMITEIGDIKRFEHPRSLVSWIGLDIREYSSGGKNPNKVKVACAREMVGFIWESLQKVA